MVSSCSPQLVLPGTSGFVGEFLGYYFNHQSINVYLTIFTAVGVILGASYMLLLYTRISILVT